jgi:hypothetical protein
MEADAEMVMTWLTYRSFGKTAQDLDNPALKLQMRNTCTIFDILTGLKPDHPKKDHPCVGMWQGYEYALGVQGMMMGMEWTQRRGFAETEEFFFLYRAIKETKKGDDSFKYEPPPWFRDADLLLSHRSNLARRDPVTYGKKWKRCPENWPYLWPVLDGSGGYQLFVSRGDRLHLRQKTRTLPASVRDKVVNL